MLDIIPPLYPYKHSFHSKGEPRNDKTGNLLILQIGWARYDLAATVSY